MRIRALLGMLVICFVVSRTSVATQPNVVILIVDDQGYGDLACHGNPVLKTPELDRLHGESIRLTDFHVAPMCTPTRGQLLTGRDALANGAMNVSSGRTFLRTEVPTMAEFFAAAGYRTGQFGKWHLGENYPYRPHDRGFDEAVYFASSHVGSAPDFWNNDNFDDTYVHNGERQKYAGYCTDVFFGEATKFIEAAHAEKKPFFVYLALNAAHGPLFVPEKYRKPYADQPHNIASFFGMIANIDENVGRFDAMLQDKGLRDDTIFIYLTDNGGTAGVPVYNAGLRGKKIDLYDGGHRVPCFIRSGDPRVGKPRDVGALTICQDLLPTLIEFCDLPNVKNAKFDGLSLVSLLGGREDAVDDRMSVVQFSRMGGPRPKKGDAAVLWRKWRLVADRELYDLATDPAQRRNVVDEHSDVAAKLRAHYDAWWSGIEPRVNEHSAITVGNDAENPSRFSPADWEDEFLDQQRQIRMASKVNGAWNLNIDRAGTYELTMSRWPLEAELPITAVAPAHHGPDGVLPEGVAVPAVRARMKIADFDASQPVGPTDRSITFNVDLQPGRTQLQTWLYDVADKPISGSYYVQVRRK